MAFAVAMAHRIASQIHPTPMRLGLIQTRGLGDIVIAAPIAQYYIDRGHEVFWPVDHYFYPSVQAAFPEINFIQLDKSLTASGSRDYFLDEPLKLLQGMHCDPIIPLYSYLSGLPIVNEKLARSLKFDEYKYAICDVPFQQKWCLKIKRNKAREERLLQQLNHSTPFILVHEIGSNFKATIREGIRSDHQIIAIQELTDNPFDWLSAIEIAEETHLLDSSFANLCEQMFQKQSAFVYLRSNIGFTPVFTRQRIRAI